MSEQSTETGQIRPHGCVCAEIAGVAGSRLSDGALKALCDRLRAAALPPAAAMPACPSCGNTDHYCGACGGQIND